MASPAAAPCVVRVASGSEMDGDGTGLKANVVTAGEVGDDDDDSEVEGVDCIANKVTAGGPALDQHLDELIVSDDEEEAENLVTPKNAADEIVIGDADDDVTPDDFNGDLVVQDDIFDVEVQSEGNDAGDEQALVDSIHTIF